MNPMLRKPEWARSFKKAKDGDVPDQITIIHRGNGQIPQPIGMRYTGTGPDEELQRGKYAGDTHEGEVVLNANTVQGIPPDVLQEFVRQAESGKLDVSGIRKALKIQDRPGYQSGSDGLPVDPYKVDQSTPSINTLQNPFVRPAAPNVARQVTVDKPAETAVTNIAASPQQNITPSTTVARQVTTNDQAPQPIVNKIATADQPAERVVQPIVAEKTDQNTTPQGFVQPIAAKPVTAAPSRYQQSFDQNLTRLQDVASGTSKIDRNIADRNIRLYDTQAGQDIAEGDLRATMLQNVPETARDALKAETRSAARAGRSELIGDMTQQSQERALGASTAAANLSMQGMGFEEDKRRYEQNFAEDKARYQDSKAWTEFEKTLEIGSDSDVAAAYKRATGNDLDPAAISTYRGYVRTAAEQSIQRGALELAQAKSSAAGTDFSAYVQNNPNSTIANDPVLRNLAQKYYETNGGTGAVPDAWANDRTKAIRDAGNAIVTFNNDIDYAVSNGSLTAEQGSMLKDINSKGILQFYKRDASGNVVFDWDALAKASGSSTTTTDTDAAATVKVPEGKEPDDIFEQDGKIYRVDVDGTASPAVSKDLTWEDIKGSGLDSNSFAYKAVLKNTEPVDLQYKSSTLTDSWKVAPEQGQVVKAMVGGKEVLLITTYKGTQDVKLGFDNAYIEFEDMQGNKYYAGGPDKSTEIKPGTKREQTGSLLSSAVSATPAGRVATAVNDPSVENIAKAALSTTPIGAASVTAAEKVWDWVKSW
jgi:hypothetical protein